MIRVFGLESGFTSGDCLRDAVFSIICVNVVKMTGSVHRTRVVFGR